MWSFFRRANRDINGQAQTISRDKNEIEDIKQKLMIKTPVADGKLNEDVDLLRTGSHEEGTLVREEFMAHVGGLNCTFKLCPWHTFSKATSRKWGRQNRHKHFLSLEYSTYAIKIGLLIFY